LPQGIEECRYVRLITREGFEASGFQAIVPPKRRRNCYRVDDEQMFIELTNGRSDIYDVLTHLTFLYIEAEKIRHNSLDPRGRKKRDWINLEQVIEKEQAGEPINREVACTYLSGLLGRTFEDTLAAVKRFETTSRVNSLFHIAYWMGRLSIEEALDKNDREITFSSALREIIGHHIFGSAWADGIKQFLHKKDWLDRPIHIISSNPHSVMNCLYAFGTTSTKPGSKDMEALAREGISPSARPADPFDPRRHCIRRSMPTVLGEQDRTIGEVLRQGFVGDEGWVIRRADVHLKVLAVQDEGRVS
jgi:hypothetical protein